MNIVIIITDTQPTRMVGCYSGNYAVGTPNIDRFAAEAVRFTRAYTACPLCTPARSAMFSGQQPQVNGAHSNSLAPGTNVPLMGTVFSHYGYRCAYSGKWHLDGTSYFGDGMAGGGFEQEWWFDGRNYADFLGPKMFSEYIRCNTPDMLRSAGFDLEHTWGHQVANRAINFMRQRHDQPFLLVASFDEPHSPYVCPPEYWEQYDTANISRPENYMASLDDKPALQRSLRSREYPQDGDAYGKRFVKPYACNHYIDTEIGRVLDCVNELHGEDTMVIYTSDHGEMQLSHGLNGKGPMMYEEVLNIPMLVRHPGGLENHVCREPVSQVDILPTLLEACGQKVPGILHGRSFMPQLSGGEASADRGVLASYTRFAMNHDGWGGLYPIRCLIGDSHKLVLNLFDRDEFYALDSDPHEMTNLIDDSGMASIRDAMHGQLLDEMDRIRDPFRGDAWAKRPWADGSEAQRKILRRSRPDVFPFQAACIEADGQWSMPVGN